jgi:putative ABC transport system permease protein
MLTRYVLADLIRNPRRTLSTMVGVTLGVGLFCGVLFFVDGLSASMTQRAVAPLSIDMQRIVTERVGGALTVTQHVDVPQAARTGDRVRVELTVANTSKVAANEVTIRSIPTEHLGFVSGSAHVERVALAGFADNPFAHGPGQTGFNLGTVPPGEKRHLSYTVAVKAPITSGESAITTTFSSRESVSPVAANQPSTVPLEELANRISRVSGVAYASQLSFADLGPGALSAEARVAPGTAKILGFDADYARHDSTVRITRGKLTDTGGVLSAEAATALGIGVGDQVSVTLPDSSTLVVPISGIADLTRARSLFSSRRGGDLETFIYTPNSIVVSPRVFAEQVLPAFERAATQRGTRLKNPPVREIDITLDRAPLDADPAAALRQTKRVGAEISTVAAHQDYLLDNISNTLAVASADASVAKRLFVFLGVPGGLLAAMLAAYAGSVLAEGQRREQAVLRIRGASRRHLLRMLTLRTALLTASGSVLGLGLGYLAAVTILGPESLSRASIPSLIGSALIGTLGGFVATGGALYLTGRRSIDREINEDRAVLANRAPAWRRLGFDVLGVAVVAIGTFVAVHKHAFDGVAGSVYFGRSVSLNLSLLVLPVAIWIAGSLLAARLCGGLLTRTQPRSSSAVGPPLPSLFRFTIGRRPWPIANGAVVVSLIVALAVSLVAFTASYDTAKALDARYANGSDIRITPSPTGPRTYSATDAKAFRADGIAEVSPVIYGISNVILRSARTSDPANVAAIDADSYLAVAPAAGTHFTSGTATSRIHQLRTDPSAVLVSEEMAEFLKAKAGDNLHLLLARATPQQTEVTLHITGLYERLPGFPDGVDAVMALSAHTEAVPSKAPDFFLASTKTADDTGLATGVRSLQHGPQAPPHVRIDTRKSMLASDQSSLAALNISGLVRLDQGFALAMATVAVAIFIFGLLLQRRREYITLRAQGLQARTIRLLIAAEASTVAAVGSITGLTVGAAMGYYLVTVLRPLFVLTPSYTLPTEASAVPVVLVSAATLAATVVASRLVNRLQPTELLREE